MKFHSSIPLRQRSIDTPLGRVRLAATPTGLAGLWFDGQKHHPDTAHWPEADAHDALLDAAEAQLHAYFTGQPMRFDLPLDLSHGTPFQQAVWRELLNIARGRTVGYGELAARLGQPRAVRAVGAAVGRNPISVIVPCHRVVGARGALTGYAGGLERKTRLLVLEGAMTESVVQRPASTRHDAAAKALPRMRTMHAEPAPSERPA